MKLLVLCSLLEGFLKHYGNVEVVIKDVDSDKDMDIEEIFFIDGSGKLEILIDP